MGDFPDLHWAPFHAKQARVNFRFRQSMIESNREWKRFENRKERLNENPWPVDGGDYWPDCSASVDPLVLSELG
jgi:hypothetical protein